MDKDSGISTFRDNKDGLWENMKIEDVATIQAWRNKNKRQKMLDFYNERRNQLLSVQPHEGHILLAELEKFFDVTIITQNVTDLHERAGSTNVIHLHGELMKACSSNNKELIVPYTEDIKIGDKHEDGSQLRPYIVWFGEEVPMMQEAIDAMYGGDIFVVIGTSLQVYPAASLIHYTSRFEQFYLIDPNADEVDLSGVDVEDTYRIAENSNTGVKKLIDLLKNNYEPKI